MGKFMKKTVLEGANSAYKIAKLNVLDSATHAAPSEVDIGFAAKTTLEKFTKRKRLVNFKCWNSERMWVCVSNNSSQDSRKESS